MLLLVLQLAAVLIVLCVLLVLLFSASRYALFKRSLTFVVNLTLRASLRKVHRHNVDVGRTRLGLLKLVFVPKFLDALDLPVRCVRATLSELTLRLRRHGGVLKLHIVISGLELRLQTRYSPTPISHDARSDAERELRKQNDATKLAILDSLLWRTRSTFVEDGMRAVTRIAVHTMASRLMVSISDVRVTVESRTILRDEAIHDIGKSSTSGGHHGAGQISGGPALSLSIDSFRAHQSEHTLDDVGSRGDEGMTEVRFGRECIIAGLTGLNVECISSAHDEPLQSMCIVRRWSAHGRADWKSASRNISRGSRRRSGDKDSDVHVVVETAALLVDVSPMCLRVLNAILGDVDEFNRYFAYRQVRPRVSVKRAPYQWWSFAVNSIIREVRLLNRPKVCMDIEARRTTRAVYEDLYIRHVTSGFVGWLLATEDHLSTHESAQLSSMENSLTVEDIAYFRCLAFAKYRNLSNDDIRALFDAAKHIIDSSTVASALVSSKVTTTFDIKCSKVLCRLFIRDRNDLLSTAAGINTPKKGQGLNEAPRTKVTLSSSTDATLSVGIKNVIAEIVSTMEQDTGCPFVKDVTTRFVKSQSEVRLIVESIEAGVLSTSISNAGGPLSFSPQLPLLQGPRSYSRTLASPPAPRTNFLSLTCLSEQSFGRSESSDISLSVCPTLVRVSAPSIAAMNALSTAFSSSPPPSPTLRPYSSSSSIPVHEHEPRTRRHHHDEGPEHDVDDGYTVYFDFDEEKLLHSSTVPTLRDAVMCSVAAPKGFQAASISGSNVTMVAKMTSIEIAADEEENTGRKRRAHLAESSFPSTSPRLLLRVSDIEFEQTSRRSVVNETTVREKDEDEVINDNSTHLSSLVPLWIRNGRSGLFVMSWTSKMAVCVELIPGARKKSMIGGKGAPHVAVVNECQVNLSGRHGFEPASYIESVHLMEVMLETTPIEIILSRTSAEGIAQLLGVLENGQKIHEGRVDSVENSVSRSALAAEPARPESTDGDEDTGFASVGATGVDHHNTQVPEHSGSSTHAVFVALVPQITVTLTENEERAIQSASKDSVDSFSSVCLVVSHAEARVAMEHNDIDVFYGIESLAVHHHVEHRARNEGTNALAGKKGTPPTSSAVESRDSGANGSPLSTANGDGAAIKCASNGNARECVDRTCGWQSPSPAADDVNQCSTYRETYALVVTRASSIHLRRQNVLRRCFLALRYATAASRKRSGSRGADTHLLLAKAGSMSCFYGRLLMSASPVAASSGDAEHAGKTQPQVTFHLELGLLVLTMRLESICAIAGAATHVFDAFPASDETHASTSTSTNGGAIASHDGHSSGSKMEGSLVFSFVHVEMPVHGQRPFAKVDVIGTRLRYSALTASNGDATTSTSILVNEVSVCDCDQLHRSYRRVLHGDENGHDDLVVDMTTISPMRSRDGSDVSSHTAVYVEANQMRVIYLTRFINSCYFYVNEVTACFSDETPSDTAREGDDGTVERNGAKSTGGIREGGTQACDNSRSFGDADADGEFPLPSSSTASSSMTVITHLRQCSVVAPRHSDIPEYFVIDVGDVYVFVLDDSSQSASKTTLVTKEAPPLLDALTYRKALGMSNTSERQFACESVLDQFRRYMSRNGTFVHISHLSSTYNFEKPDMSVNSREFIPPTDLNVSIDGSYPSVDELTGSPRTKSMTTVAAKVLVLKFAEDEYNLLMGIIYENMTELSPYEQETPGDLRPGDPQKPGVPAMHTHGVEDLRKYALTSQFNVLLDRLEGYNSLQSDDVHILGYRELTPFSLLRGTPFRFCMYGYEDGTSRLYIKCRELTLNELDGSHDVIVSPAFLSAGYQAGQSESDDDDDDDDDDIDNDKTNSTVGFNSENDVLGGIGREVTATFDMVRAVDEVNSIDLDNLDAYDGSTYDGDYGFIYDEIMYSAPSMYYCGNYVMEIVFNNATISWLHGADMSFVNNAVALYANYFAPVWVEPQSACLGPSSWMYINTIFRNSNVFVPIVSTRRPTKKRHLDTCDDASSPPAPTPIAPAEAMRLGADHHSDSGLLAKWDELRFGSFFGGVNGRESLLKVDIASLEILLKLQNHFEPILFPLSVVVEQKSSVSTQKSTVSGETLDENISDTTVEVSGVSINLGFSYIPLLCLLSKGIQESTEPPSEEEAERMREYCTPLVIEDMSALSTTAITAAHIGVALVDDRNVVSATVFHALLGDVRVNINNESAIIQRITSSELEVSASANLGVSYLDSARDCMDTMLEDWNFSVGVRHGTECDMLLHITGHNTLSLNVTNTSLRSIGDLISFNALISDSLEKYQPKVVSSSATTIMVEDEHNVSKQMLASPSLRGSATTATACLEPSRADVDEISAMDMQRIASNPLSNNVYVIRNLSGLRLSYCYGNNVTQHGYIEKNATSDADVGHVEPGEEHVLLQIPPKAHVKLLDGHAVDARVLTLHIEGALESIGDVIVDKTGVYAYRVKWPSLPGDLRQSAHNDGSSGASEANLLCEVTADGRSKYVIVRSRIQLLNATNRSLSWKYLRVSALLVDLPNSFVTQSCRGSEEKKDESAGDDTLAIAVAPQSSSSLASSSWLSYVPLHFQTHSLLQLGATGYFFSEEDAVKIDDDASTLIEQQGLISCYASETLSNASAEAVGASETSGASLNCSLKVVKTTTRTRNSGDVDEYSLIFKSPLQIENMLPFTVQLTLHSSGRQRLRYEVVPGQRIHVTGVNMAESMSLMAVIGEPDDRHYYEMKRPKTIHRGSDAYGRTGSFRRALRGVTTSECTVVDPRTHDRRDKILITNSFDAFCESREVCLSSPLWILNTTDKTLFVRDRSNRCFTRIAPATPGEDVVPAVFRTRKVVSISTDGVHWSKNIPVTAIGMKQTVTTKLSASSSSSSSLSAMEAGASVSAGFGSPTERILHWGLALDIAPSPFQGSKVLTVAPRYVLCCESETVEVMQRLDSNADDEARRRNLPVVLGAGMKHAFHWPVIKGRHEVCFRPVTMTTESSSTPTRRRRTRGGNDGECDEERVRNDDSDSDDVVEVADETTTDPSSSGSNGPCGRAEWCWSGGIKIDSVGETCLRIYNRRERVHHIFVIDVELVDMSVYVRFIRQLPQNAPCRIENRCAGLSILYQQKCIARSASNIAIATEASDIVVEDNDIEDVVDSSGGAGGDSNSDGGDESLSGRWEVLHANDSVPYAWDDPTLPLKLRVRFSETANAANEYSFDEIKVYPDVFWNEDSGHLRQQKLSTTSDRANSTGSTSPSLGPAASLRRRLATGDKERASPRQSVHRIAVEVSVDGQTRVLSFRHRDKADNASTDEAAVLKRRLETAQHEVEVLDKELDKLKITRSNIKALMEKAPSDKKKMHSVKKPKTFFRSFSRRLSASNEHPSIDEEEETRRSSAGRTGALIEGTTMYSSEYEYKYVDVRKDATSTSRAGPQGRRRSSVLRNLFGNKDHNELDDDVLSPITETGAEARGRNDEAFMEGGDILVTIHGAKDVMGHDKCAPFVVVSCEDQRESTKTATGRSPEWEETIHMKGVGCDKSLRIACYNHRTKGKDIFLGEAMVALSTLGEAPMTEELPLSRQHTRSADPSNAMGSIHVTMSWQRAPMDVLGLALRALEKEIDMKRDLIALREQRRYSSADEMCSEIASMRRLSARSSLLGSTHNTINVESAFMDGAGNKRAKQSLGTLRLKVVEVKGVTRDHVSLNANPLTQASSLVGCNVYVKVIVNRDSVPHYNSDVVKVPGATPTARGSTGGNGDVDGSEQSVRFNAITCMEGVSLFDRITIQVCEKKHAFTSDVILSQVDFPCYTFRSERRWYIWLGMRTPGSGENNGRVYFRVEWRKRELEMEHQTNVRIILPEIGLTLTEHNTARPSRDLAHVQIAGLACRFSSGASQESLSLEIRDLQLDNQLLTANNVVVLAPTYVMSNDSDAAVITVSYVKKPDERLVHYQYFSILVQELDFVVEEEFLGAMIRFILDLPMDDLQLPTSDAPAAVSLSSGGKTLVFQEAHIESRRASVAGTSGATRGEKMYFELLHIHPIKINLNVFLGPGILQQANSESNSGGDVNRTLGSIIAGFGLSMIDVQRAPLKVNSLAISNALISQSALQRQVAKYYTYQLLAGFHRILGSVELLGSPIALINNLGTGVLDFFYEPAKGFVHGPEDFARGVAVGTMSLLKSSVYGVFNSVGQMTGSVGKSLAMLSMDDSYMSRYKRMATTGEENLLRHAQDLGMTIVDAITGIVRNPYMGAERDGLKGFVRGVATGIAGAAIKPTSGALEFASRTVNAFGSRVRFLGEDHAVVRRGRSRDPRYYGIQRSLTATEQRRSELTDLIDRERHRGRKSVLSSIDVDAVRELIENKRNRLLLFTDDAIMYVNTKTGRLRWKQKLRNVVDVIGSERLREVTISFRTLIGRLGCCNIQMPSRKVVYCKSPQVQQNLHKYMLSLLTLGRGGRGSSASMAADDGMRRSRGTLTLDHFNSGEALSIMTHAPLPGARSREDETDDFYDDDAIGLSLREDDGVPDTAPHVDAANKTNTRTSDAGFSHRTISIVRSPGDGEPEHSSPPPTWNPRQRTAVVASDADDDGANGGPDRDGAGSGEMQMTHKEEEMTDCDTKQRVSDNEILLSLSVSALRSVCFNLLTRMDDAGVRRIAGVEEGGLLETLVHRVLRQRDAPDVDASRACVLSPLSEIWDRIGLRGDADFATDLDLIVGLTGMFLGDSSTTALWKQDTADIAAATPPRTATPRTATRRLRRLELMDDAVAVVPMTH